MISNIISSWVCLSGFSMFMFTLLLFLLWSNDCGSSDFIMMLILNVTPVRAEKRSSSQFSYNSSEDSQRHIVPSEQWLEKLLASVTSSIPPALLINSTFNLTTKKNNMVWMNAVFSIHFLPWVFNGFQIEGIFTFSLFQFRWTLCPRSGPYVKASNEHRPPKAGQTHTISGGGPSMVRFKSALWFRMLTHCKCKARPAHFSKVIAFKTILIPRLSSTLFRSRYSWAELKNVKLGVVWSEHDTKTLFDSRSKNYSSFKK